METAVDSIDNKSTAARYAFAVLTAVLALVLRQTLSPLLGANNPYFTVWAAVVFSAWYYGVGPSVVTTLMSALGVWYWFLLPLHSFRLQDSKMQIGGLVGFGVLSGFIIALGEKITAGHTVKGSWPSNRFERRNANTICWRTPSQTMLDGTRRRPHFLVQRKMVRVHGHHTWANGRMGLAIGA